MHPLFGTDASNFTTLQRLPVPEQLDLIIDDAAHVLSHQITSLEALWPKLAPGGVFIVEDLTVGALPWLRGEALQDQVRRAPSNNSDCKGECHYVQRPAEHPFLKRLVPSVEARKEAEAALKRGAQPQHPAPTAAAPSTYGCSPPAPTVAGGLLDGDHRADLPHPRRQPGRSHLARRDAPQLHVVRVLGAAARAGYQADRRPRDHGGRGPVK